MKKTKRLIALALAMVMLLMASLQLASCDFGKKPEETTGTGAESGESGTDAPGESIEYSVTVKSEGGMPISGVTIYVHDGQDNIKAHADTDANGVAAVSLPASPDYWVELDRVPEGYAVQEKYTLQTSGNTNIVLTSSVIGDSDISSVTYKNGSIFHDFEVTLTDGSKWKLSEVLKTKKAVMLNFWYTTCTYCIEEFPGLNSAYNDYKDDIAVVALNAYSADSYEEVKLFKESYYDFALDLPMAKDVGIQDSFGFTGNPVSVMIDRYGMVTLVHMGAISEYQFRTMFEHYSSDDYTQKIYNDVTELVPKIKPNVEMPSSDEMGAILNSGNINVTYGPETDKADAEMSWPFMPANKNGVDCIAPANKGIDGSFATLHAKVTLKKGEALVFDYFSSTGDILYVLVDEDDIYQITGVEQDGWKACCPWVAVEDGTYDVAFVYLKGTEAAEGDDSVYLKNFRVVAAKDVPVASYIPREAATKPTDDGSDYLSYASVVYSDKDGYYHVGTADGPILLARLIYNTRFSQESVSAVLQSKYETSGLVVNGVNKYDALISYCNYAANSQIYTYCSVNKELRECLEAYVKLEGFDTHENTWLQLCSYYDAYGVDENGQPTAQLADPIKGLSTHSAYIAEADKSIRVEYSGIGMIPRGYLYKFVPTVSGAYRITSANTDQGLIGWVFIGSDEEWRNNGDRILYAESDVGERICEPLIYVDENGETKYDSNNISMAAYFEAGKEYYIDIAFADVVGAGSFTFEITRIGDTFDYFIMASPGYFTFEEGVGGTMGDTVAGGIDVVLGDDGYYYHKKEDGSLGSKIYADFYFTTGIFTSESIENMIDKGAFDFSLSELDHEAKYLWEKYGKNEDALRAYWGIEADENWELYQMDDIIAGKYHGEYGDLTSLARSYAEKMIPIDNKENPELGGCIPVDRELAELLQKLMDKYTFAGVENSWTKVCFYYEYLGK